MNSLKIGFIGCGKHATANIYPSIRLLGANITSVAAQHMDRAAATAKEFHAERAYDNYREMLKEDLDAVFVITQGEKHAEIVKDCLLAGKHVFVEKPLGLNEREASEVAELAVKTGKQVMVGFMKRYASSYMQMKNLMNRTDDFGKVVSFGGMFGITSGRKGWGDEVFLKFGAIHYVDLMRYLFGEAEEVCGFSNSHEEEVDQVFTLRFANGTIGNMFFAGLPAWRRLWEEITVTGIKGFVKVDNLARVTYHFDHPSDAKVRWQVMDEEDRVLNTVTTSGSGGWQHLYLNGYVGEVEHFLQCVKENKEPDCSAQDNVKTMALADRILNAIKR
jgi:predicted dehydrogenase